MQSSGHEAASTLLNAQSLPHYGCDTEHPPASPVALCYNLPLCERAQTSQALALERGPWGASVSEVKEEDAAIDSNDAGGFVITY